MKGKDMRLLSGQRNALDMMMSFAKNSSDKVFILKGYAGTGKTTLIKALLSELDDAEIGYSLLASTGRAAKILSDMTGASDVRTVHSLIYKYLGFNQDPDRLIDQYKRPVADDTGQLSLIFGLSHSCESLGNHVYIVDEASMVADKEDRSSFQAKFGSGRLLSDLLSYDEGGKFIFVGDVCQLPPPVQPLSPALSKTYFKEHFGLDSEMAELNEIVRQASGNGIVKASARMRQLYYAPPQNIRWAKFPLKGYGNIHLVQSQAELLSLYIEDLKRNGYGASTMITVTNRQCHATSSIVRSATGHHDVGIAPGDLLLVTQNNLVSGLMNGDLVEVVSINGPAYRRAGLTFQSVSLRELSSSRVCSQYMIMEVPYSTGTSLNPTQQKDLYIDFLIRMKDRGISDKSDAFEKEMRKDPYLNALRCVYGYVLTCHKAQGGEWDSVYLDIPRSFPLSEKPYVYQWIYTAMTRAKKDLYVTDDFYII